MPTPKQTAPRVLGIGAPFVDYVIDVDDEFVQQLSGQKGGMLPVNYQTFLEIIKKSKTDPKITMGGSCANTMKGLAQLGHHTSLAGKIGKDAAGILFLESLKELGMTSFLLSSDVPTSQVICLITPDKERTMRSFLGASEEMKGIDLNEEEFQGVAHVHLEGYSIMKEGLAEEAMRLAKNAGATVSYDLGSFEVVRAYKKTIIDLLSRYVDIVFANREETLELTQKNPEQGLQVLRDLCDTAVVLLGEEGCRVASHTTELHCPAQKVTAVDSTGAGDLFASGFLHGYLQGLPLNECARFGSLTGAAVVQVHGIDIAPTTWNQLRKELGVTS